LFTISSDLAKVSLPCAGGSQPVGNVYPESSMQKGIGDICLVIGLWLLFRGHDAANSIGSQFARTFTGVPASKATHFYLAGMAMGLFGGFLIFWKRK
jgi:Protein of unknown function (DUF3185)